MSHTKDIIFAYLLDTFSFKGHGRLAICVDGPGQASGESVWFRCRCIINFKHESILALHLLRRDGPRVLRHREGGAAHILIHKWCMEINPKKRCETE